MLTLFYMTQLQTQPVCGLACATINLTNIRSWKLFLFQVAGLVSCVMLLVVMLAMGPYFKTLPTVSNVFLFYFYNNLTTKPISRNRSIFVGQFIKGHWSAYTGEDPLSENAKY